MIRKVFFQTLAAASIFFAVPSAIPSGIMTLNGKLKSYTETTLTLETTANFYVVNKAGLSQDVLTMLKTKRTGQALVLTVSTEALASVEAKSK